MLFSAYIVPITHTFTQRSINNPKMGKYNHISELTGTENYLQWSRQMILVLQGKRLWPHCSNGTEPTDFANYASTKPVPKDLNAITTTE